MKARIGGWRIDVDVVRNLGEDPHTVGLAVEARSKLGSRITADVEISASEAADLAPFFDGIQSALDRASDADECDGCAMPCDPGEAYCPRCQERAS